MPSTEDNRDPANPGLPPESSAEHSEQSQLFERPETLESSPTNFEAPSGSTTSGVANPPQPLAATRPPNPRAPETSPVDLGAVSTTPPPRPRATSAISNGIMMLLGAGLAAGGYGLARVYSPPDAPGEVTQDRAPAPPSASPDELNKLTARLDELKYQVDEMAKQKPDRPDLSAELKPLRDVQEDLTRKMADLPAQFDSINQKIETVSKIRSGGSGPIDADVNRRLDALTASVDSLKARLNAGPANAGEATPRDINVEGRAMDQAVDLFKAKKYPQADEAFARLRQDFPENAVVWYYSALAHGLSTKEWRAETEQFVMKGMEKEKANPAVTPTLDRVFSTLTLENGRDWLAAYRQRIKN